jgi:methanogenic corrinoid protein MtbC1
MENQSLTISQELINKKSLIANYILPHHYKKIELTKSEKISYLKQKTKEDTYYNIYHLSEAIRYESKDLFGNYIIWLKTLLKYYGVPKDELIEHFCIFKDAINNFFDIDSFIIISDYLDIALEALEKSETAEESFLGVSNKYSELARTYLNAILQTEKNRAINIILNAVKDGVSIQDIYLNIFQPVQYEVGLLWQTKKISVGQEHYATAVTQLAMSQLYPYIFTKEKKFYRFVACGVSEELHELGIRMVADIFELNGWDTYFLGANTPAESIIRLIEEKEIQVLAVSATILYHLRKVDEFIATIRNYSSNNPKIIVGGHAFRYDNLLWKKVGADAFANDPISALSVAKNIIN